MVYQSPFKRIAVRAGVLRHAALRCRFLCEVLLAAAGTGVSVCACAATTAYNPDALGAAQLARVEDVCQNIMGLSSSEPLTSGYWIGGERLDFWTSHYRGCVLSLSDSLGGLAHTLAVSRARQDCQARGLKEGSPELALCILGALSEISPKASEQVDVRSVTPLDAQVPRAGKSFYSSSPRETVAHEQVACAALGLEPGTGAFTSCVRELDGTLYAIDHPSE